MTVLQSLDKYYDRMAERGDADPPGYSRKSIDLCIWLNVDGSIANVSDLNDYTGKKPVARRLTVPQEVIRTSGVSSNFLWDKTAYALGVGKDKDKKSIRHAEKEHEAFKLLQPHLHLRHPPKRRLWRRQFSGGWNCHGQAGGLARFHNEMPPVPTWEHWRRYPHHRR